MLLSYPQVLGDIQAEVKQINKRLDNFETGLQEVKEDVQEVKKDVQEVKKHVQEVKEDVTKIKVCGRGGFVSGEAAGG